MFASQGRLLGVPFDLSSGAVTGPAVVVVDDLLTNPASGAGQFSIADDGTLVYARGGSQPVATKRLLWVDRTGQREVLTREAQALNFPRISPDGGRIVMTIERASDDVWTLDMERGAFQRWTFGARHLLPTWGPGAGEITYSAVGENFPAVFIHSLESGESRHLAGGDVGLFVGDWSADGTTLAAGFGVDSNWNIVVVGTDGQVQPLLDSPFSESAPRISPDCRWLAHVSDESGCPEVYVASFPRVNRRMRVSIDGGSQPVWARSGKSLFFLSHYGIHEVEFDGASGAPDARSPVLIVEGGFVFAAPIPGVPQYDIDIDAQRFLVMEEKPLPEIGRLEVVLNWFEELEQRMAVAKSARSG